MLFTNIADKHIKVGIMGWEQKRQLKYAFKRGQWSWVKIRMKVKFKICRIR